jgi:serine phosphatase RsbU (regulator of sigma subunit)
VITRDGRRDPQTHEATLPPLGIIPALPETPPAPVQLGDDAWLMVATDGITEAFDPQGEMFGDSRLVSTVAAHASRPDEAIQSLKSTVWQWQGKEDPVDDQTVVVVVRK